MPVDITRKEGIKAQNCDRKGTPGLPVTFQKLTGIIAVVIGSEEK